MASEPSSVLMRSKVRTNTRQLTAKMASASALLRGQWPVPPTRVNLSQASCSWAQIGLNVRSPVYLAAYNPASPLACDFTLVLSGSWSSTEPNCHLLTFRRQTSPSEGTKSVERPLSPKPIHTLPVLQATFQSRGLSPQVDFSSLRLTFSTNSVPRLYNRASQSDDARNNWATPQAKRFKLHQRPPPSYPASYSIDLSSWTERCRWSRPRGGHIHAISEAWPGIRPKYARSSARRRCHYICYKGRSSRVLTKQTVTLRCIQRSSPLW